MAGKVDYVRRKLCLCQACFECVQAPRQLHNKKYRRKNLQDLNSHYGKVAGYIDSAGEDTASALKIYLGEQAANYILALASFESDAVKPYTESEVIRFIRFCKSKRARLVKASAGVFGVPGTVSLIKKLILKR